MQDRRCSSDQGRRSSSFSQDRRSSSTTERERRSSSVGQARRLSSINQERRSSSGGQGRRSSSVGQERRSSLGGHERRSSFAGEDIRNSSRRSSTAERTRTSSSSSAGARRTSTDSASSFSDRRLSTHSSSGSDQNRRRSSRRGSCSRGQDSRNSRRRSSRISGRIMEDLDCELSDGNESEESPLDISDFGVLFRQLRKRLLKRANMAKAWLVKRRSEAMTMVSHELQQGWGKTKTARAIGDIRKFDKRAFRKKGKDMLKKTIGGILSKSKRLSVNKADEGDEFGLHKFIIHNTGDISDFFVLDSEEIKTGGTAKILRGTERATHVVRAIKRIFRQEVGDFRRLLREVSIMKTLDHPNIIRLFETFEDDRSLYLVLELCEGGDVLDRLLDPVATPAGAMTELQTSIIMRAVLMCLNYLRSNGVVHRDIKPENILFKDKHQDILTTSVRLADFGYATKMEEDARQNCLKTKVGSIYYVAPEVLNASYDERCDLWSVGACTYTLLCGYPPFLGESDAKSLNAVREGDYVFHKQTWHNISKPAKHFVRHLLKKNPADRLTVMEALRHPWIRSRGVVRIEKMREETVDRLMAFHKYHRLRKSAMLAIAHQLETSEIRGLIELFQCLDVNGDGLLTVDEFKLSVQSMVGVEEGYIQEMMNSVDADGSGVIDFSEFVAATLEKETYAKNHAALLRAFRCFDQDDGGSLSMEEIAETLCMEGEENAEDVASFFKEVDLDGDGVMDYGEFYQMLSQEVLVKRTSDDDDALDYYEGDDDPATDSSEEAYEENDSRSKSKQSAGTFTSKSSSS